MVRVFRCMAIEKLVSRRVVGRLALVLIGGLATASVLSAQEPPVHYLHQGMMPPGAIGSRHLQRRAPLLGYFQPVEIRAPAGAQVSLAVDGRFAEPTSAPRQVGMLIGQVYRIRVTNIPRQSGMEVFPTIEVIDRTYAPVGQQRRFAIPVELSQEDMELAMAGKFVTRVIYLEDPHNALPVQGNLSGQNWFEAAPGQDPLAVADALGRPVAILRIGARLPSIGGEPSAEFLFGSPPVQMAAGNVHGPMTNDQ